MKPTTLAVALACSLAASAQSPISGLAQGAILKNPDGTRHLMRKPAGDLPVVPFTSVSQNTPLYRTEALLHHLGAGAAAASEYLQLNAISTGNDVLPIEVVTDSQGHLVGQVSWGGTELWAAIAITVDGSSSMAGASGVFADRLAGSPGIGSDVFSYWFSNNAGLPNNLVDQAHFEVGVQSTGQAGSQQVSAMDPFMPAILEDRMSPLHAILFVKDKWYFTLTKDSADHIKDQTNWGTFAAAFACSQGEIGANFVYEATWEQTAPGNWQWSKIDKLFSPAELGINANDEIDAIAFLRMPNFENQIVFSLKKQGPHDDRSQILVGGPLIAEQGPGGQGPANVPVVDVSGVPVTTKIGLGNNTDVDSICTIDPEHTGDYYGAWIAYPVADPAFQLTQAGIGCSAARYRVEYGNMSGQRLRVQATSLPTGLPGAVGFFIDVGGSIQSKVIPVTGSRMEFVFSLPPVLPQGTVINIWTAYASRIERRFSWEVHLKTE